MFDKILIANRGEIACRVIRTARKLGVASVAVYSDSDVGALHVEMADEAIHIGGSAPSDSYLNIGKIVAAAEATGAQAIHPGYGFLSENPAFVAALDQAGLVFIGPQQRAIEAMGLKGAAKSAMEAAGVPVVPGYHGPEQDAKRLSEIADEIGYPILIKAVAGGGGKGMRLVNRASDFLASLQSAKSEAANAFGDDKVLIEKFVAKPRHIEFQIFGDGTKAVHLFERDCSLQRRHQKVIEEAPAPGMTEEMRAAMSDAAVKAANAIDYKGAGTIEFIVDASEGLRPDRFWFMEMNTRLQVEHPVTEAVTGIDLVEWQLRVAAGESLPLSQEEITCTGHAMEARIYAEDVPNGFLPAPGRIEYLDFADNARVDTGVRSGDEISTWYDPMIAKLTVHGSCREIALSKLSRALDNTKVAGTVTNLTFLRRLSRDSDFSKGNVDTALIERGLGLLARTIDPSEVEIAAAAIRCCEKHTAKETNTGFYLWVPLKNSMSFKWNDKVFNVNVIWHSAGCVDIEISGNTINAGKQRLNWYLNERFAPPTVQYSNKVSVFGDDIFEFEIIDPLEAQTANQGDGGSVQAPMPGLVKEVFVTVGSRVVAGERLAILEAMKMEHTLLAQTDGIVEEVLAMAGKQVEAGSVLVVLKQDDDSA